MKFLFLVIMLFTASQTLAAELTGDEVVWLDVRTVEEYAEGYLQPAILIPHEDIGDSIAAHVPDKDQPINLFCRTGNRAGIAKETLEEAGYTNVRNIGSLQDAAELYSTTLEEDEQVCCL